MLQHSGISFNELLCGVVCDSCCAELTSLRSKEGTGRGRGWPSTTPFTPFLQLNSTLSHLNEETCTAHWSDRSSEFKISVPAGLFKHGVVLWRCGLVTLTVSHERQQKGQQWDSLRHSDVRASGSSYTAWPSSSTTPDLYKSEADHKITPKIHLKKKSTRRQQETSSACWAGLETGEGMEEVVHWSEVWKTGRLEHEAVTMSFLDLQWRLPLPFIFTMGTDG